MKDQIKGNVKSIAKLSKFWRFILVLLGPLLICLTIIVFKLVPPILFLLPFWLLGLIIFFFIQLFGWVFGLAWFKNGGIKFLQKSSYIKNLQNKNEHTAYNFFGFMTAAGIGVAIIPNTIVILLISFLTVFGYVMEGALS